mmetsp:Transcript_33594/g.86023  ORF Transcript_33594/g.86023 Transcript_33594/m.86023 type:complete len:306 (+) Transcript_33594:212-1129(+)
MMPRRWAEWRERLRIVHSASFRAEAEGAYSAPTIEGSAPASMTEVTARLTSPSFSAAKLPSAATAVLLSGEETGVVRLRSTAKACGWVSSAAELHALTRMSSVSLASSATRQSRREERLRRVAAACVWQNLSRDCKRGTSAFASAPGLPPADASLSSLPFTADRLRSMSDKCPSYGLPEAGRARRISKRGSSAPSATILPWQYSCEERLRRVTMVFSAVSDTPPALPPLPLLPDSLALPVTCRRSASMVGARPPPCTIFSLASSFTDKLRRHAMAFACTLPPKLRASWIAAGITPACNASVSFSV